MTEREQLIYDMIVAAAGKGHPCPSNEDIRRKLRLPSASTATNAVKMIEARGLISVQRFNHGRVITVTATGKSTSAVRSTKPHHTVIGTAKSRQRAVDGSPGPVPATTADDIDDGDTASAIRAEARRLGISLRSFIDRLIKLGWLVHLDDLAEEAKA